MQFSVQLVREQANLIQESDDGERTSKPTRLLLGLDALNHHKLINRDVQAFMDVKITGPTAKIDRSGLGSRVKSLQKKLRRNCNTHHRRRQLPYSKLQEGRK